MGVGESLLSTQLWRSAHAVKLGVDCMCARVANTSCMRRTLLCDTRERRINAGRALAKSCACQKSVVGNGDASWHSYGRCREIGLAGTHVWPCNVGRGLLLCVSSAYHSVVRPLQPLHQAAQVFLLHRRAAP